jgi:hypothetical protein
VESARALELNIPFGDVQVEGVAGGPVRVRVEATCSNDSHCDEFLEGLRLEAKRRDSTLKIKLEGPEMHAGWDLDFDGDDGDRQGRGRRHHSNDHDAGLRVTVQVPRSLALDLNIGAGEVSVQGLRHDVSVNMGAGEVNVSMAERSVESVDLTVAVGEARIHQGGRTSENVSVLGGPVRWRGGKGDAGIEVNMGAGEVEVTLE